MANNSSTKKAIRKTIRVSEVNKSRRSKIRTFIKRVVSFIKGGSKDEANNALREAQSEMMKGVSKNIIKKNTASRKISRLSQAIKNL